MVDVVVVGAGITGAATAYQLARAGCSVVLLDRFGPAAMASGWTLAGVRQSGRHPAELPLARAAVAMWDTLAEELDGPTHYRRSGNLRVARTPEEAEIIRQVVRDQSAAGLDITLLADNAAVRAVAPALSDRVLLASHCTSDGSADPVATVQSFVAAATRLGVQCRFGERALQIETQHGKAVAVVTDRGRIATEKVVIAAGIFGNELLAPFGIRILLEIPMVTVLRSAPMAPTVQQVVSTALANCTGRQQHDGCWRVTNGAEPWHGTMTEIDGSPGQRRPQVLPPASAVADVVSRFGDIVPAFRDAHIEQIWAGLLDLTPDALPVLDSVPGCEGAVLAMGFSGHGFCLGPVSGRILANLVLGRAPGLPLDPFRIERFQSLRAAKEPATLHG